MSIPKQRSRALAILEKEKDKNGYSPIDYVIDDECRKVLDLPDRPRLSPPYTGWMMMSKGKEDNRQNISKAGLDLIKKWESLRTKAYLCPANVWTIGYGHTKTAKPGMCISSSRAYELLIEDVQRYEDAVRLLVKVPLEQHQFDALVSFVFNVGIGAFRKSTLLKHLNKGKYKTAALQLHRWVNANGKKLKGLVNRRNDEYDLFVGE